MRLSLKSLIVTCCLLIAQWSIGQGFNNVSPDAFNFVYGAGEYGAGMSYVDFDQDGDDDLTFPSGNGDGIRFFESDNGSFTEVTPFVDNTTETKQTLWVDYDNDGDLDLYVCSRFMNRLYKNNGNFEFEDITLTCGFANPNEQSFCASWLDFDNDGLLDLCVSHRTSYLVGQITLYKNLGSDQFEDVTIAAGLNGLGNSVLAMATLDFNNDGLEDIYVGQDFDAGNMLLKNLGDGTFLNISDIAGTGAENNTMTCTIGDFNNDGWMDIYVTNTSPGNSFYINQGDETFIESAEDYGIELEQFTWGAVFVDADNDMDLDLYINGIDVPFQPNSKIFENQLGAEIPFVLVNDEWGMDDDPVASVGNSIGDHNSDGFVDIAKMNNGSFHTIWENTFTENAFLHVDLEGEISNSMAVGAVVEVVAGGTHQYRRVGCGEGFSSQNSYTQFFGLGQNFVADSLIVNWPSGLTSIIVNIPANQSITVNELDVLGCIDELACNYDVMAQWNDGSCEYAIEYFDCEGMCLNDSDGDEICDEFEIPGCTDGMACNFNSEATDDDESCEYPEPFYDCEGNCLSDIDSDGICDELEILGCQDDQACNFSSEATEEDGSCEYVDLFSIAGETSPWLEFPFSYSYQDTDGSYFDWVVDSGTILSGDGSSAVTVEWDSEGAHSLSVRETNIDGCVGEWVELDVAVSLVSIEENNRDEVKFYPNPAINQLNILIPNSNFDSYDLIISDSKGSIVHRSFNQDQSLVLDVSALSSGIYIAVISYNSSLQKFNFVIER